MKILVINSGSSSLKYQLFDMTQNHVLAKGLVDKIGLEGSVLKHKNDKGEKKDIENKIANHTEALKMVLDVLIDPEIGVIKSFEEIDAVGHRVVHGGELFAVPTIITPEVKETLKELIPLAPLHNPANIMGIESVEQILPGVTNVAVFDTGFHQSMDPSSYLYAIPYKYYEKHKIRRYGFHGISHEYVFKRSCEILGKDENNVKTITCHIGNGASIAAIHNGKVLDTSMGMTPLEGLAMGTRCGDLDPAIIYFLEKNGKRYFEFNPKEVIKRGQRLNFISSNDIGELEIVDIIKEGGQELEKATCNTPKVFVLTNKELNGWEILYE